MTISPSDTTKQRRYNTLQIKEITEHRWYLSEKTKGDVGSLVSANDWITTLLGDSGQTHATRFRQTYVNHEPRIHETCNRLCGPDTCYGIDKCKLPKGKLHELLED